MGRFLQFMYLFILPVKHTRWPGLLLWASLCSGTTEQKNKESEEERRMKQGASWRSLRTSGLSLTLYIRLLFFIFLRSHSSPCSHLLCDNPLHPSLQSYNQFNLWPWILQAPLTSKPVASGVENTLIHPYLIEFLRFGKCEIRSEHDSFTSAAPTTGRFDWVTLWEWTDMVTSRADPSSQSLPRLLCSLVHVGDSLMGEGCTENEKPHRSELPHCTIIS